MRKFSTDAPQFFVFQLGNDEKTYKLPLVASMPVKAVEAMEEAGKSGYGLKWQLDFLRKHMGKAVVDNLPSGVASEILKEWSKATEEQGATTGES